ncbi:hypothetical protein K7432_001150 [Basidiobolus ranarum]|uniref:FCP1 homology domain-containing protein n=1 Tax=Basidiobolus ranarum TaxID=34480 RepID=A0ABR2WA35_9FUNG
MEPSCRYSLTDTFCNHEGISPIIVTNMTPKSALSTTPLNRKRTASLVNAEEAANNLSQKLATRTKTMRPFIKPKRSKPSTPRAGDVTITPVPKTPPSQDVSPQTPDSTPIERPTKLRKLADEVVAPVSKNVDSGTVEESLIASVPKRKRAFSKIDTSKLTPTQSEVPNTEFTFKAPDDNDSPIKADKASAKTETSSATSLLANIFSPALNFLRKVQTGETLRSLFHDEKIPETNLPPSECMSYELNEGIPTFADNQTNLDEPSQYCLDAPVNISTPHTMDPMDEESDFEEEEFNPYQFMATIPPPPAEALQRPSMLPRKTRSSPKITLVLDLDETLVHCTVADMENPDVRFPVRFQGIVQEVHGRLRPHALEFLERASEHFEIAIFTASQKAYADRLLNLMDPKRSYIKYRLFRDSCVYVEGNYIKDLRVLGRDLAKTIIVDNSPIAFSYQITNGVPIKSWYDDPDDTELLQVLEFLQTLVDVEDVRPLIDKQFQLTKLVQDSTPFP